MTQPSTERTEKGTHMSLRQLRPRLALAALLLVLAALVSCGGGSSSSQSGTGNGSSNWDALVWDQDKWS